MKPAENGLMIRKKPTAAINSAHLVICFILSPYVANLQEWRLSTRPVCPGPPKKMPRQDLLVAQRARNIIVPSPPHKGTAFSSVYSVGGREKGQKGVRARSRIAEAIFNLWAIYGASPLRLFGAVLSKATPPGAAPRPEPEPQHHQCDKRTRGIEQRIVRRSGPAGHERLMKFICQRVRRSNQQRGGSPGPTPAGSASSHRAIEQHEIYIVFRQMRALTNDVMHEVILALRQARNQPAQNRFEEPFRVFG